MYCQESTCTVSECCVDKEKCDTVTCDDGEGLIDAASTTPCAKEKCDETDKETCCEPKGKCTSMIDGDGAVYCSSFSKNCEHGGIPNAASKPCDGNVCTEKQCCLTASGVFVPTELSQAAARDTFKAAFKLEANFEALQADPDLAKSLKTSLCKTFAQSTGTQPEWCDAQFSAGSVNAEITITAPEGESLPSAAEMQAKTPSPEKIVNDIVADNPEGAKRLQKGDKPLSATKPEVAFFKKGSTKAEVTSDPQNPDIDGPGKGTSDKGSKTDTDDTDGEDDSSAGFSILSLLLAVTIVNFSV